MRGATPTNQPVITLGRQKRRLFGREFSLYTKPFLLEPHQYKRHFHYIGVSGSGKSTAIASVIVQHIMQGRGISLIDPHGDLALLVMEILADHGYFRNDADYDRIRYFDFGDPTRIPPLNVLHQPAVDDDEVASALAQVCLRIWPNLADVGVTFLNVIKHSAYALVQAGLPMPAMKPFLEDPQFREMVLSHSRDPHIRTFFRNRFDRWKDQVEKIESTENRIDLFTFAPRTRAMFSQRENIVDYDQIMQEGTSVIYNVSAFDEEKNNLIAAFLFYGYERAAHRRARIREDRRVPYFLFADEFQNFTSKNSKSFGDMLSGVRKYRLFLSLANQNYGQVSEEIKQSLGNADTMVFKLTRDDALWMAPRIEGYDEERIKHRVEDKQAQDRSHPLFASPHEQFEKTARELERLPIGHCYARLDTATTRIVTTPFPKPTIAGDAFQEILEEQARRYLVPLTEKWDDVTVQDASAPVPIYQQGPIKRRVPKLF